MIFNIKNRISKSFLLISFCFAFLNPMLAQDSYQDLKLTTEYFADNPELKDVLRFQGIEYMTLKFTGEELIDKSYHLTVKEFWKGKMVSDTTVFNSETFPFEQFKQVNDTVFSIKVISELTRENKLRMQFNFPRFSMIKEFDAIETDDYSLRNIAEESRMPIGYGEKFYLLAYILPYDRGDGSKSWCDVGSSGKDIENWGEKFGIEHYLLFEMKFD